MLRKMTQDEFRKTIDNHFSSREEAADYFGYKTRSIYHFLAGTIIRHTTTTYRYVLNGAGGVKVLR